MRNLTARQLGIVNYLRVSGETSVQALASAVNAPQATVRRNIQVLRKNGYNIQSTEQGTGWTYRLA